MRSIFSIRNLVCAGIIVSLAACNKDVDDSDTYYNQGSLAITGFSLKKDVENTGIDSVYFAIDLNNAVVYNADSLPVGTSVNKLIPVIKYSNDVQSAVIDMSGGTTRTGTVNYITDPTDSIDFTGKVTFTLTRGNYSRTYNLKVNVHKEKPDSLRWDEASISRLPSRFGAPVAQKTVKLGNGTILSFLKESNGSYTVSTTDDIATSAWHSSELSDTRDYRIETLANVGNDLYILDRDGNLYRSNADCHWQPVGEKWTEIIGGYTESLVGLRNDNGKTMFAQYPQGDLNVKEIPADFPVRGFSNFVTLQNKWTLSPVAFFAGGVKADSTLSSSTWAFDGSEWVRLNDAGLPAMESTSIIPYFYFRATAKGSAYQKYSVWMAVGGRMADNKTNRTVYISYDNGVNWRQASSQLQLPDAIPDMWGCDNIVVSEKKQSNLSDNWKTIFMAPRTRADYEIDNDIISWDCPYIYLIGGHGADGTLYDTIWRGVLNRLSFVPVI